MTARRTVRWFHDVASPDFAGVLGGFPLQLVLEESSIDAVFVAVSGSSNAMVLAVEILFPFIELFKSLETKHALWAHRPTPAELARFVVAGRIAPNVMGDSS